MNFWTRTCFFIFLFLYSSASCAQEDTGSSSKYPGYVYWNFGSLLNIPSGLQFGYTRSLKNDFMWDIEAGLLLFSKKPSLYDFNARNKKGIRGQTGFRYLLNSKHYIGIEYLFKRVTMQEFEWVVRYDGLFWQRFDLDKRRITQAAIIELGWFHQVPDSKLAIDISGGFGMQRIQFNILNLPDDATLSRISNIFDSLGTVTYPTLSLRVKLLFGLGSLH